MKLFFRKPHVLTTPWRSGARAAMRAALALAVTSGIALGVSCQQVVNPGAFNSASGSSGGTSGTSSGTGFNPGGDGGPVFGASCGSGGMCQDFPSTPILDMNAPSNAASMFGAAGSGSQGGPCLYEPPPNALYPNNWLRPRFYWNGGGSGNQLYELRLSSPHETNDLVVYTTATKWTMDKTMWTTLAGDLQGSPITVSIRQMTGSGPSVGTESSFTIAPAPAQGALVFWATNSFMTSATATDLQGFQVGDETTATVLTPGQVAGQGGQTVWAQPPDGGNFPQPAVQEPVGCIGCHTSTPDGKNVGFTAQWPWPNVIASVQADAGTVGSKPSWLSAGAIGNMNPNVNDVNWAGGNMNPNQTATNNVDAVMLGITTFSKAHYQAGDRIEVTSVGASLDQPIINNNVSNIQPSGLQSKLIWIDLEWNGAAGDAGRPSALAGVTPNGGWGFISTGDSNSNGSPNWSHDGTKIAYTSVNNGTRDGRLGAGGTSGLGGFSGYGQADIKIVPYNAHAGGTASSLQGASDSSYNEYFPAFSPDDALIAFNRTGASNDMYQQPQAEVFVVPASGGTAVKLEGNNPAACSGKTSPGVQNTWPKWAPAPAGGAITAATDGKLYYWVTFSSMRVPSDPNNPASMGNRIQLYIAGVSVDPNNGNAIATYPAIYLWNQDPTYNNLIPAWDNFAIANAMGPPR